MPWHLRAHAHCRIPCTHMPLICPILADRRSGTEPPLIQPRPPTNSRNPPPPPARALTRRLRATISGVSLWQFLRPLSAPLRTSVRTSGRSPRPDAECSAELPEYICAFTLAPCCGRGGASQDHRLGGRGRAPGAGPHAGAGPDPGTDREGCKLETGAGPRGSGGGTESVGHGLGSHGQGKGGGVREETGTGVWA